MILYVNNDLLVVTVKTRFYMAFLLRKKRKKEKEIERKRKLKK